MRFDKLVIKLSRQEKAEINKLAKREQLPLSTMARSMLLKAASRIDDNAQILPNANSDVSTRQGTHVAAVA